MRTGIEREPKQHVCSFIPDQNRPTYWVAVNGLRQFILKFKHWPIFCTNTDQVFRTRINLIIMRYNTIIVISKLHPAIIEWSNVNLVTSTRTNFTINPLKWWKIKVTGGEKRVFATDLSLKTQISLFWTIRSKSFFAIRSSRFWFFIYCIWYSRHSE